MIFRTQKDLLGKNISNFESKNALLRLIYRNNKDLQISMIELESDGILGLHQADTDQIFILIHGSGWIRNQDSVKIAINEGDCIFWQKDEWHETSTDIGLKALIIEGTDLYPGPLSNSD